MNGSDTERLKISNAKSNAPSIGANNNIEVSMNPQVKVLKEEAKTRAYLQARNELKRDVQKAIENFKNRTGVSVSKIQVIYSQSGTPMASFWFDM